jgi:hypothetical protein
MKIYYYFLIFTIFLIFILFAYAYNSGSCKINKRYICNEDFCLFKEFNVYLNTPIKEDISKMTSNNDIQKRVSIRMLPETFFNCALPNKSGTTISTNNINIYSPSLIKYYQNELCNLVSKQLNLKLYPTSLSLPTTCAILIYDKEGDWINWHYDHNYYNGRFFTVLIPITNNTTCTQFQFMKDNGEIKNINISNNNSVCFEGNFLYHRATKLCKDQKRIILSCQYVTDNSMSFLNKIRIKLKDFAYTGSIKLN